MKKAIIIGASSESLHAIEVAKRNNVFVTAIDGNPKADGLKYADEAIVCDISNEAETIRICEEVKPDFIIPVPIGRYLTTIGAVNDKLCLKGISKEAATRCTDKYLFHTILHSKGLRNCNCLLINKDTCIDGTTINYPAIMKPRFGSGSRGIYFINNASEFKVAFADIALSEEDFILEDVMPGDEYGVDGSVIDGKFSLVLLRKKENTPPPARQAVGYSACYDSLLLETVNTFLKKVCSELGLNNCLFHADLLIEDLNVSIIEASARPSGHYLHNVFTPVTTGIDVIEEFIKFSIGKDYSFVPTNNRKTTIHFFNLPEGTVNHSITEKDVFIPDGAKIIEWKCNIKEGDFLAPITTGGSLIPRGYYIWEEKNE